MEIIPAIDIIDGKCVRLTKGDYSQKTIYNENPVEVARQFEEAGLSRLHLVDLDGAKAGNVINWKVLENIAKKTNLVIDFSGGIGSEENLKICFDSGAEYAAIGSMAIKKEDSLTNWISTFGTKKFILAADVKNEQIVVRGWTETSTLTVFEFIEKYSAKGINQFFCTDVNKDGALQGPATDLYRKITDKCPSIHLIASGGVSNLKDLEDLKDAGCTGVIIGKAIYENRIKLSDLINLK